VIMYQFLDRLKTEGHVCSRAQVHYALLRGEIDKPEQDCLNTYLFQEKHVQQMVAYLRKPKTRGRKPRNQLQAN